MSGIPFLIRDHYKPIGISSVFVYDAFNHPQTIIPANADSRAMLIKSFPGTWHNSYSFGIPGKVEIEYPLQFDSYNNAYTWMPIGKTLTKISTGASEWKAFKRELIAQSLRQHELLVKGVLKQHLAQDILSMVGVPLLLLIILIAIKRVQLITQS